MDGRLRVLVAKYQSFIAALPDCIAKGEREAVARHINEICGELKKVLTDLDRQEVLGGQSVDA